MGTQAEPDFAGTSLNIEEMEAAMKAGDDTTTEKPDLEKITLDEGVPENLKGKSVKEVLDWATSLKQAFDISEAGRMSAQAQLRGLESRPAPLPVTREGESTEPRRYTREEIKKLALSEDPEERFQGMELMNHQYASWLAGEMDKKYKELSTSTVSHAESEARTKYPLEFELFGDQIEDFVGKLPDKSSLSTVNGWRNAVSYIRGLDGNIDKYALAKSGSNKELARETQSRSAGFTPPPNRSTVSSDIGEPDEFTVAIAKSFGRDPREYHRELMGLDKGR